MLEVRSPRNPLVTFVDPEGGREIPWGNGGGSSRELILRSHPDRPNRLLWRMSTTQILGSCPFSAYAGYDRTITLLSGDAFTLEFPDEATAHTVARFEPFDFSGGWKTYCRLPGETATVLNVMADETMRYTKAVVTIGPAPSHFPLHFDVVLLYVLDGDARLTAEFDLPVSALKPGDMLAIEHARGQRLSISGDAKVIAFSFG